MKIISLVGTRPQFLKLAPLSKKFEEYSINHIVIHSGQHYDKEMSEDLFKVLEIKDPTYILNKEGTTSIQNLSNMMIKLEEIFLKEKPDKLIVFGDCDTTIAGSIVAKKLKIFLIHIEAGMRSYNKNMPEEINRLMTDHISDLLLCSTEDSMEKLKKENIYNNIYYVGNLQLELLKKICEKYNNKKILNDNNLIENNFVLLTIHREYNTNKEMLLKIFSELEKLEIDIIFPIHPRTNNIVENNKLILPKNLKLIKPVDYLDMTILERFSKYIITDSGGVQPEAWFLGKKCIIMRSETEWIEPLKNNNNILYDYNLPLNIFIDNFLKVKINEQNKLLLFPSQNIIDLLTKDFNSLYIPLGIACKTASILEKNNLRKVSFPFDYLNCDLKVIKENLINNLSKLLDKQYYYFNEETQTYGHKIYGRKLFMHYKNFDIFSKYCNRLLFVLKNFSNITFVTSFIYNNDLSDESNINEFKEIRQILLEKNINFKFKLLIINNNSYNINFKDKDLYIVNIKEKILGATHIPNELSNESIKSLFKNTFHVIYTKFMYVSKDFLQKGCTKEKILTDENILPRLEYFKKYYLNWVQNQSNQNFICVIIIDKDLPIHLLNKLQEIIKEYKNIILIRYNDETLSYNTLISNKSLQENYDLNLDRIDYLKKHYKLDFNDYKKDFDKYFDYVITTRIDDDDMIPNWYINYLQSIVCDVNDFKLVGGNTGYVLLKNDLIYKTILNKLENKGMQSIGLSLIQKTNNNIKSYFNIFSFSHHICIENLPKYKEYLHLFKIPPIIDKNNINKYYICLKENMFLYNRINSTSIYNFENLELVDFNDNYLKKDFNF